MHYIIWACDGPRGELLARSYVVVYGFDDNEFERSPMFNREANDDTARIWVKRNYPLAVEYVGQDGVFKEDEEGIFKHVCE